MWEFELYVNDNTRRSTIARENLSAFCDKHLEGHCHVQVFGLSKHPEMGFENNICVTPTLIKRNPSPIWMMVGDLSDAGSVAKYLEIPLAEKTGRGRMPTMKG
jgi:hypothetical protein